MKFIRAAKDVWRAGIWILWAFWWGGLSFYAIAVVPIGTEQIGSQSQGFITQWVTHWHNLLGTIMTICLAMEGYRTSRRSLYLLATLVGFVTSLLFVDHWILSSQMNFQDRSVSENFYKQHVVYLWITTVEWFLGLLVPFVLQAQENPRRLNNQISEEREFRTSIGNSDREQL